MGELCLIDPNFVSIRLNSEVVYFCDFRRKLSIFGDITVYLAILIIVIIVFEINWLKSVYSVR